MVQFHSFITSRSVVGFHSYWPIFLFSLYSTYLFSAITVPIVGKVAAGLLLLVGLLGLLRLKKNYYSLMMSEKWLLASFTLFSLISILSYFYWPQSREARMHLEDYLTFMMLLPLYLLLRQFRFKFNLLVRIFALVAIVLGSVSIAQFISMKYYDTTIFTFGKVFWLRPSGGVNPMRYAAISLVFVVFSLNAILVLRKKTRWLKFLLVLAACMGLAACLFTQVRGSWLAIPVLILAYCVYLYRAGRSKYLYTLLLLGVIAILGAAQTQIVQSRAQLITNNIERYQQGDGNSSVGARIGMFKAALILIKQKPVFGHGLNSYARKATEIRKKTPNMSIHVGMWANPHNEILQVLVEKGLIGLFTLLLLFAAPAYLFIKALRNPTDSNSDQQITYYAMSGLGLLIVYIVAGQSVALFEHDVFNHFFALMVLLFASQIRVISYLEENTADVSGVESLTSFQ
jgi:O-antigen ligase